MKISSAILAIGVVAAVWAADCPKKINSKLICYYSKLTEVDSCKCTHVVLPANSDVKSVDRIREGVKGVKILISVNEFNQGLVDILKSSKVDGVEINLTKLDSKNDINDFISTVRTKLGTDLYVVLSVPSKTETLAKYYDFKTLSKNADLFVLQTAFLGASKNVTFHPSRLSGLWDMQNTDSVVDLVTGLGAPLSKVVVAAPVQAFKFRLQSETHTAPGSPALEVQSVTRDELCRIMKNGDNWTLERDQDQAGPYIFSKDQWIAFDDATSVDIKAKYARVRGLAGLALKDLSQDGGTACESSILDAAFGGLSRQSRAPRGAVLHSLEREILDPSARPLDTVQVSPYRISRVIDVEGNVHVVRQDTRTEFECSRQGYFVHPRSCGRFYRCVKFNQLSDEFSVFEFDCPAGLAFDSRVEVCVWPGSLPNASPCSGSSEIAPVPRERFVCPGEPGYYADPENCRWFFACLDHGKSPLSAYEFRCPFGLVYDESRLLCEWPWLVPRCVSGYAVASQTFYGGAVALDQYDGLGILKVTRLGGLHGPLQQPQARVYSNVGLLSQEQGQLSLKAAQSLQNAGLLRGGLQGSLNSGSGLQGSLNSGLSYSSGLQGSLNSGSYSSGLQGSQGSLNSGSYSSGLQGSLNSGSSYASGLQGSLNSGSSYSSGLQGSLNSGSSYSSGLQGSLNSGLSYSSGLQGSLNSGASYASGLQGSLNTGSSYASGLQGSLNSGSHASGLQGSLNSGSSYSSGLQGSLNSGSSYSSGLQGSANSGSTYSSGLQGSLNTGSSYASGLQGSLNSGLSYTSGNLGLVDASQNNAGAVYQEQNSNLGLGGNSRLVYTQNSDYRGAGYDLNSQNIGASLINVGLNQGNLVTNTRTNYVEHGANSNSQTGSANLGTNLDVSSGTTLVGRAGVGSNLAQSYVGSNNAHLVNGLAVNSGAGSSQYHSSGTNGNINIVGGGYSAVGVSSSGLDLSRLAENSNTIAHVTASPSISSIPTVTSVPVPALDVASGFESYKGGVVANIPELQYRIENNLGSSRGSSGFANLSTSFVNVVSSTPSTILTDAGYQYPKPTVGFVEEPLRNYQKTVSGGSAVVQHASIQPVIVSTTQTPVVINKVQPTSTSFVQQHVAHIQPVVSTTQVPYVDVQPVVSTYHQKIQPVVTTYQKVQPVVTTYQKVQPAVATYQNVQPVVTTYHNVQPAVVSSTQRPNINIQPVVTTYHHQVQQPVVVSTTSAPAVVNSVNIQPAVSTYNVQQQSNFVGYDYSKPAVKFEETPIKTTGGSYSYQNLDLIGKSQAPTVQQVFTYSTPSTVKPVTFVQTVRPTIHTVVQPTVQTVVQPVIKQQPAVAISTFQQHETVQPQLEVTSYNVPSTTVRPLVIQQTPQIYVSSTPASVQKIQPAVVSSFSISSNSGGYHYEKPSVAFEEKPSVVTYQQPAVINYQTPVQVQPAVSTYNYKNVVQSTVRPVTPVVSTYAVKRVQPTYFVSSTPKPQTVYVSTTAQPVVKQRPAVVSSYSFNAQQQNNIQFNGYDYSKPEVQFVEAPTPVVTSYENRQPVQEVPFVAKKAYVTGGLSSTYHYQEQKPVVVENYQIPVVSTTQRPVLVSKTPTFEYRQEYSGNSGHVYQQPAVAFKERIVENYQPVITRTTPRPVAVSTTPRYEYQQQYSANSGYVYQKPAVAFEERIVENYQPAITRTTPQPVTPVTYEYRQEYDTNSGYVYQKPAVAFEERIVENYQPAITRTTSRPVVISTQPVAPVVSTTPRYEHRQEYDTNSGYVYQKPAVAFEERVVENYQPAITRTTSRPIVDYTYQSTPKPTFATAIAEIVATKQPFRYYDSRLVSTSRPVQAVTTSRPIAKYDFGSFDTQANLGQVAEEYSAPIEIEQTPLVVTTSRPIAKYSFSSLGQVVENYVAPTDAITPTREYLPVRSRVRVTTPVVVTTVRPRIKITSTPVPTTPTREYLPVRSRTRITTTSNSYLPPDGDDFAVTTSRPVVRVSRPKTIVKVNDFHPLLAAKLGAQCTCVSNSIKLRNKKVRIIVEDDDDDGYVVDDSNANDGVILENYQYEPQRVVDITPTPEVYIQSSTTPQPVVPVVSVRRRVKVRPLTSTAIYDSPVTEVSELFVRKAVTPARQSPNAILSETSKNFDRYGPGGLRSRNERLQGTIDCQRAGLFRHPTQCNKFYACRWDCTKNRYTLHVFNCPVHLTFDNNLGACNWPSQGPACLENTLLPSD